MNIKLLLAYEGTHYLGWQNNHHGPSIEGALERALESLLGHRPKLQAASRTDAGVHAQGQVVNFFIPALPDRFMPRLNTLLPNDISTRSFEQMDDAFHPTLDCKRKQYIYTLNLKEVELPFDQKFSWHMPHPLQVDAMSHAALFLIGKHDFSAFTNKRQAKNQREIHSIDLVQEGDLLKIHVTGNNFLYNMVRIIVGTLVDVGRGKLDSKALPFILENKDRALAGVTAPPQGLVLKEVYYD